MTNVVYNVREGGFDPRDATPVSEIAFDFSKERSFTLVDGPTVRLSCGPLARYFLELVARAAPAHELLGMRYTMRATPVRPGETQAGAAPGWHTDYAYGATDDRRLLVHNYEIFTAPPATMFIWESGVVLPNIRKYEDFTHTLNGSDYATFVGKRWTLIKFNATELHTATSNLTGEPIDRVFFRATYDGRRFVK